jgi:hypothetical protein
MRNQKPDAAASSFALLGRYERKEKVTEQRPEQPEQPEQVGEQAEPRMSRG